MGQTTSIETVQAATDATLAALGIANHWRGVEASKFCVFLRDTCDAFGNLELAFAEDMGETWAERQERWAAEEAAEREEAEAADIAARAADEAAENAAAGAYFRATSRWS